MRWDKDRIPEGKERVFSQVLYLGSGKRSTQKKEALLHRVEEAFHSLGALQQPMHPTSVAEEQEDKEVRERLHGFIEGVVEDVAMALTGEEWLTGKRAAAVMNPQVVCKNCCSTVSLGDNYQCPMCNYDLLHGDDSQ